MTGSEQAFRPDRLPAGPGLVGDQRRRLRALLVLVRHWRWV